MHLGANYKSIVCPHTGCGGGSTTSRADWAVGIEEKPEPRGLLREKRPGLCRWPSFA